MRSSAVRLLLSYPLLSIALSGCVPGDDEALVVTGDSTLVTTEVSPRLVPSDSAYPLNDGLPASRDEPSPAEVPEPVEPANGCDPNYEPCVPIDSDVDCAGGRGNGPSYVRGPVRVVGRDVYQLDRDGDGVGCDR